MNSGKEYYIVVRRNLIGEEFADMQAWGYTERMAREAAIDMDNTLPRFAKDHPVLRVAKFLLVEQIEPSSPAFILQAQDPLASDALRYWAALAQARGVAQERVEEALELAAKMDAWSELNR